MLEFLTWISTRQRTYDEAMEAWRSSCPRHTVWEDALAEGFIAVESRGTRDEAVVSLTRRGRANLDAVRVLVRPAEMLP